MKIGLVCPYDMIDNAGGVQQVVMHLADGLVKKGHTVKIITPKPAKFRGDPPKDYIFLGTSRRLKAGLATAGDIGIEIDGNEIDLILDREKFDVINFHEPWIPVLARQIVMRSSDTALVGTFHANLSDSVAGKSMVNMLKPYGRGISDRMDIITAVSDAAAGVLVNKADVETVEKIRYIPNGIDLKRYQKTPAGARRNPKMKTILYVGRLEGRKGVKYLLKAYSSLVTKRDDVQLFIAGKGVDEDKLREYVKDNEIPRVTFLGYISDDDKIYHLHKSDLFCAPAHRGESFGIVLLEAMAAGCPIVAGDNNGYLSVMKGMGAVSLVNPLDTVDFARHLELLLYDEDLRKLWLAWAKEYVKAFDWDLIIDQYEKAYKEAIKVHANKTT